MLPHNYDPLKQRQRAELGSYLHNLSLRVYRALSCLHRAKFSYNDLDGQFVFLWIDFGGAYAQ